MQKSLQMSGFPPIAPPLHLPSGLALYDIPLQRQVPHYIDIGTGLGGLILSLLHIFYHTLPFQKPHLTPLPKAL